MKPFVLFGNDKNQLWHRPMSLTDPPKTRVSLILRLQNRDDGVAWSEFLEIYQPVIFRTARRKGLQDADAFDLTQEVLSRVANAVSTWNPDPQKGTFRAWLGTITRNMVVEFFRKNQKLPQTGDQSAIQHLLNQQSVGPDSNIFDLEYEKAVFQWAAEKIRTRFDDRSWDAFWQTAVLNRAVRDVALELEMTAGAIYIARCRILKCLREAVSKQESSSFQRVER